MAGKEKEQVKLKESASSRKTVRKSAKPANPPGTGKYLLPAVIIIAVVVIATVLGYVATSQGAGGSTSQQSLQAFQTSFYAAPRVAIYVTYTNGTEFSYSSQCAYQVIERLIDNQDHHRNASTIDFLIVANSTSCLGPSGALGSSNGTKVTPIASCLAVSHTEPSVFINYSASNSTVVRSGNLYTSGDGLFLSECGIASELG